MALAQAKAYLSTFGMDDRIQEFDVSSATVAEAAAALSCDPAHIAKTLAFLVKGEPILIVAAGDARVKNQLFKARFGGKPVMVPRDEAEEIVGHAVGGICPFGTKNGVRVYLDESLKRFDTVYPACGSSNSAIGLSPEELAAVLPEAEWVDVCKDWRDDR